MDHEDDEIKLDAKSFETTCSHCKETFKINKKTAARSKQQGREFFCSSVCRNIASGLLIEGACACCHIEIARQKSRLSESGTMYCSRSCSAKINNTLCIKHANNPARTERLAAVAERKERRLKEKLDPEAVAARRQDYLERMRAAVKRCTQGVCVCGGTKRKESAQCKVCANKEKVSNGQSMTAYEFRNKKSVANAHPSWRNVHIRNQCRSWNRDLAELPCQKCGYSLHVEFCHIKPVSSFPDTATMGEINHPENILVMCSNHHWELDNGHLLLADIPPREGQLIRTEYEYKKKR